MQDIETTEQCQLEQERHADFCDFPSVGETRERAVRVAAELGEKEHFFLTNMRTGNDFFANKQVNVVKTIIEDALMAKKASVCITFEFKEDYHTPTVPPNPSVMFAHPAIVVHDKCLLEDKDNLHVFADRAEQIAYFNALVSYILGLLDDAGYVCTSRPINTGMGLGSSAFRPPSSQIFHYACKGDITEEMWDRFGKPDLGYGKETMLHISWGDDDFVKRLREVNMVKQYDALRQGVPLDDIVHLP